MTPIQQAIDNTKYIASQCKEKGQLDEFSKELLDVVKLMLTELIPTEEIFAAGCFEAGRQRGITTGNDDMGNSPDFVTFYLKYKPR